MQQFCKLPENNQLNVVEGTPTAIAVYAAY